ncbi:MAG TPA: phosphoenolpyruvate synthase [Acidimicrobiia bacterium]|nr:phosphoenolpyruvate synthase [Acidimicrobiia bacterium]
MGQSSRYVKWFGELGIGDVAEVGGKNASLGELYRELTPLGVNVPDGFAVTADAYRTTLTASGAWDPLREILAGVDKTDVADLAKRARRAREIVYESPLPDDVRTQIVDAYRRLEGEYGHDLSVAIRSSATAEDLPTASFAGQHETFLNVSGSERVLEACRRCFASIFTDRAISYRIDKGFDHLSIGLSVGVMKMVRSDLASSGVLFTLDTESGFRGVVFITGAYGLGENVVQGVVDPDEFYVHKPTYQQGHRVVLRRNMGRKQIRMVYAQGRGGQTTANVPTPDIDRGRFCLTDDEVLTLAGYGIEVERHYSEKAGHPMPMDIEWAKDGIDGQLYLVQARPETVASQKETTTQRHYRVYPSSDPLVAGRAVGSAVAKGPVRVIKSTDQLSEFKPGEVLVADTTTPDWEPVMKTAAAIVTNRGGRTCHAAIVARELGIAAVVGAEHATEILASESTVSVSCAQGDIGFVYAGEIPTEIIEIDQADVPQTNTDIMLNLGNPDLAFGLASLPADGVGLARMEFIISESIRAHPMALLDPEAVEDADERTAILEMIAGHADGADFFVQRLSEGVGTIAAAFYPRPVVVRMSDFKTNEYASLLGGRTFEPVEANPMLGFRGASRYAHPAYRDGFALECRAMRRARNEMGLTNIKLMIPFCRRVEEGERVLEVMAENGLRRGENGLEVYVMCEIPNNVVQVEAFARIFDGFSIGSNDLTQLVLGVDRDSELVAFEFDERDEGVVEMLRQAIVGAHRSRRHVGICGQGPSDFPDLAERLVEFGIDSMSLNPDTVVGTRQIVAKVESRMEELGLVVPAGR